MLLRTSACRTPKPMACRRCEAGHLGLINCTRWHQYHLLCCACLARSLVPKLFKGMPSLLPTRNQSAMSSACCSATMLQQGRQRAWQQTKICTSCSRLLITIVIARKIIEHGDPKLSPPLARHA